MLSMKGANLLWVCIVDGLFVAANIANGSPARDKSGINGVE